MKWYKAIAIIATFLILGLSFYSVFAFEVRGEERVVIEKGEVVDDDLYVGAREVIVKGTIKGDLVVAGQKIVIEETGVVEGDLYAAGQTIEVWGKVIDDMVAGGYALSVGGEVGGDFIGAGFSSEIVGRLGQDFLFFGYQSHIAGDVGRNLWFAGNGLKLTGYVGGNAEVDLREAGRGDLPPGFPFYPGMPTVPQVPPGLTIDKKARIGGNLRYIAREELPVPPSTVGGKVEFRKYEPPAKAVPPFRVRAIRWGLDRLRYLVSLLIVGALMLLVAPKGARQLAEEIKSKPLPSFGWGIVTLVMFLLLLALLLVVVLVISLLLRLVTIKDLAGWTFFAGLTAGAAGFLSMRLALSYVAMILVGLAVGVAILQAFRSRAAESRWWPMLLGVFILVLVTSVPILGGILSAIASVAGLGSFWLWAREASKEAPPSAVSQS